MSRLSSSRVLFLSLAGLLTVGAAACGPSVTGNGVGSDGGSNANGDAGSSGPVVDAKPCAAKDNKAQDIPLDMYIMLDQSGSMGDPAGSTTKWDAVTKAIETFVGQSGLDGISVGLQYFPLNKDGSTCPATCTNSSQCGTNGFCALGLCTCNDSCMATTYANPDVGIASLPGVKSAITASINKHGPTGGTPTSAALQGAVDQAKTWEMAHPDHATVVVLATDGDPQECDTTPADIEQIAADAATGAPKILTFVIGIGDLKSALDGIAQKGGTNQAIIVDPSKPNVNQQFLDALNKIRNQALGCQYEIPLPTDGNPDYNKVAVEYKPGDGSPATTFPRVQDKSMCPASGDGWYYDNNKDPKQIILCANSCKTVSADSMGQIDILTGCSVVVK